MARGEKHVRGSLHKGTMAGSLKGVHHSGMKGSIRHKAHWSTRPTKGKHHSREHTRKTGSRY